jgi:hypothetical protein
MKTPGHKQPCGAGRISMPLRQPLETECLFLGWHGWLAFQNMVLRLSLHSSGQGVFIQEDKWHLILFPQMAI